MKKILALASAVLMLAGCCTSELDAKIAKIKADKNLTEEQIGFQVTQLLQEDIYQKHPADSMGLDAFRTLCTNYWSADKSTEEFAKASELIRNNELINTKMESIKHALDVVAGKPYIEISGPDAITGDTISIGDILKQGKPVIVDFWASWCGPCRKEIKESLLDLAKEGKYNIVGIAVWEESVDDTRKATESLDITWPVIYTGGRQNSPSINYGIMGIPTLYLISPEGTILGSSHIVNDLLKLSEGGQ